MAEYICIDDFKNENMGFLSQKYQNIAMESLRLGMMVAVNFRKADVEPVVHSRFVNMGGFPACERCAASPGTWEPKPDNPSGFPPYCYACGAKMDMEATDEQ